MAEPAMVEAASAAPKILISFMTVPRYSEHFCSAPNFFRAAELTLGEGCRRVNTKNRTKALMAACFRAAWRQRNNIRGPSTEAEHVPASRLLANDHLPNLALSPRKRKPGHMAGFKFGENFAL
jgi:hypothetical protein